MNGRLEKRQARLQYNPSEMRSVHSNTSGAFASTETVRKADFSEQHLEGTSA
jgi:hypothetical protein